MGQVLGPDGNRSRAQRTLGVLLPLLLMLTAALVVLAVVVEPSEAQEVSDVLDDVQPVGDEPVTPGFPIDYVAVTWAASDDVIDEHDHAAVASESHGAVRFRRDGVWGSWVAFVEEGAQAPGQWSSSVVYAAGAEAYQIRGVPSWAESPRAIAISSSPVTLATQSLTESACLSRAEWGADESKRFVDSVESWVPTFFPVQGLIVHHTVTANDDPDPAATVRAIYHQHAVLNDWGDIAYQYLIDEAGRVYEGRWSGTTSTPCGAGGDGSDFGHNSAGDLVTGGHTGFHNQGNAGVALLGNFASAAELGDPEWVQVAPKPAAVDALAQTLGHLAKQHDIDPLGEFVYANPMCDLPPDQWEWDCSDEGLPYFPGKVRNLISGHRDWRATACPGATLYPLLGDVRNDVEAIVNVHTVALVDPAQGIWYLYDNAGVQLTSFFYGNPGDYPIMGDWNGDGDETPGLYRQADGFVYLRNSNSQGIADIQFFFGNPGDVPIAGDFNNDGFDTVSIYRPSNQTFYIINELGENDGGLGAAEFFYVFGNPGDKPFVGDFDGDGTETVGLHRESTGLVYFRNSHTQGNADAEFIFGNPGDRLVAGDWTGDSVFTPALFRPSDTTMYFRHTNTQGNADNEWTAGQSGWLPVSGRTRLH